MIIDLLRRFLVALKKTIPAVLLLGSLCLATTARGQMTLNISQSGSDLVLSFSGSWSVWTPSSEFTTLQSDFYGAGHVRSLGTNHQANTSNLDIGASVVFPGTWGGLEGGLAAGDSWGFIKFFDQQHIMFAPYDYTQGATIQGTLTFANRGYDDFGGIEGESGMYVFTNGNTLGWSVGGSAVPEPGAYASILGVVALVGAVHRRRWRGQAKGSIL